MDNYGFRIAFHGTHMENVVDPATGLTYRGNWYEYATTDDESKWTTMSQAKIQMLLRRYKQDMYDVFGQQRVDLNFIYPAYRFTTNARKALETERWISDDANGTSGGEYGAPRTASRLLPDKYPADLLETFFIRVRGAGAVMSHAIPREVAALNDALQHVTDKHNDFEEKSIWFTTHKKQLQRYIDTQKIIERRTKPNRSK